MDTLFLLAQKNIHKLQNKHLSICTAESFTGGMLAYNFSRISGASQNFFGGIVSYSNEAKHHLLFVPKQTLQQYDAVSKETIEAMLDGAIKQFNTDFAIATSGFAGPSGESIGKIFLGIKHKGGKDIIKEHRIFGNREQIQKQGCELILRELLIFLDFF